jgi:hypothetical protein
MPPHAVARLVDEQPGREIQAQPTALLVRRPQAHVNDA